MAKPQSWWPWIVSFGLIAVVGGISFGIYSVYRVSLTVRDAYSVENASYAIAKFIDKQKRPPESWEELDSSIRDACAETGYNYEDVIANARIDFALLKRRAAWNAEAPFVTTETGAYLSSPTPNGRILEHLLRLESDLKADHSKTSGSPME